MELKKVKLSDDDYFPDLTKLQKNPWTSFINFFEAQGLYMCSSSSAAQAAPQEKDHQIWKKTALELENAFGVLVVNTNQRLLMQKLFESWTKN